MAFDPFGDLKRQYDAFERKMVNAENIFVAGLKGGWDTFTSGKSPFEVRKELIRMEEEFQRKERERYRRG
jgi:hypothetical protein